MHCVDFVSSSRRQGPGGQGQDLIHLCTLMTGALGSKPSGSLCPDDVKDATRSTGYIAAVATRWQHTPSRARLLG